MKVIRHIVIIIVALLVILGIPFSRTSYFAQLRNPGADAEASASIIIDQPSGEYVVLINEDRHTNAENLAIWKDFFAGKEIPFLFEDIVCTVGSIDGGGLGMAQSYQSRLPENQMQIRQEDITLLLSKAEYKRFDIIVLSKEFADMFGASTLYDKEGIYTIMVGGEGE